MKPADDPSVDWRALVRRGYDRCSEAYTAARAADPTRALEALDLAPGADVLDLGCGAGVPIARALAARQRVTGVDFSQAQIRRARENVPNARFLCADLLEVDLPAAAFDAALAFHVVFHLPREEHATLFRRIHGWLRPGGRLLATVTRHDEPAYTEDDFFGATMYWSNWSLDTYRDLLTETGFEVLQAGDATPSLDGRDRHPLVLARKPARAERSQTD